MIKDLKYFEQVVKTLEKTAVAKHWANDSPIMERIKLSLTAIQQNLSKPSQEAKTESAASVPQTPSTKFQELIAKQKVEQRTTERGK